MIKRYTFDIYIIYFLLPDVNSNNCTVVMKGNCADS